MTEIYEDCCSGRLNLPAFILALAIAPLVVAMLGFWVFLIPVFALAFGYVPYLIVGGLVLLLYLSVLPHIALVPTALLFGTNYVLFNGDAPLAQMLFDYGPSDISLRLQFGSFFAPLWGLAFESLYAATRRFS